MLSPRERAQQHGRQTPQSGSATRTSSSPRRPSPPTARPPTTLDSFRANVDPAGRSYDEGRDFQTYLGSPALSNFYKVSLGLSVDRSRHETLSRWLTSAGVYGASADGRRFEFLCCETLIPGTALDAFTELGSYQGIEEFFPGRRIYTDISLSFYVSSDYLILKFFQEWINFINPISTQSGVLRSPNPSGYNSLSANNFYHRYRYPNQYKTDIMIHKFERDMQNSVSYKFLNAFPVNISSLPLSYDSAQILKIIVDFKYDRYIITSHDDVGLSAAQLPVPRAAQGGAQVAAATGTGAGFGGAGGGLYYNVANLPTSFSLGLPPIVLDDSAFTAVGQAAWNSGFFTNTPPAAPPQGP